MTGRIQTSATARARWVLATALLMVVGVTLVFPVIAAEKAARVVDNGSSSAATPILAVRFVDRPGSRTPSLGVRALPLLSPAAEQAFRANPSEAESAAVRDVFDTTLEGLEREIGKLDMTSVIGDMVQARSTPSIDARVIDYASLLLLNDPYASGRDSRAGELVRELADLRPSCDSSLAYAHYLSLTDSDNFNVAEDAYRRAVGYCGEDPTAAVAYAYYHLSEAPGRGCGAMGLSTRDKLAGIIDEFESIRARFPAVAAAHAGAGDARRAYAALLESFGVAPFEARRARVQALADYDAALDRSADPVLTRAVAATYRELGEIESASATLGSLIDIDHVDVVLRSDIAAQAGDFQAAADLLEPIEGMFEPDEVRRLLNPSQGIDETFLAGYASVAPRYSGGGGGCGGSAVADHGLVRRFRATGVASVWDRSREIPTYRWLAGGPTKSSECDPDPSAWQCQPDTAWDAEVFNNLQDMLRQLGHYRRAQSIAQRWIALHPRDPVARDRLGEICFLRLDWTCSLTSSLEAVDRYDKYPIDRYLPSGSALSSLTGPGWAQLRAAYALHQTRSSLGVDELAATAHNLQNAIAWPAGEGWENARRTDLALLDMYASALLGDLALDDERYDDALRSYEDSIRFAAAVEDDSHPVLAGSQHQRASLAAAQVGSLGYSVSLARQAVTIDPGNPLYRETMADASRAAGDTTEALRSYEEAVALDETLFSSWNNLGVMFAAEGRLDEAMRAFESALQGRPQYATAWFNLGIAAREQGGLDALIRSEGAFGRAGRLDGAYRSTALSYRIDEELYLSGLDVSKPIPASWRLSDTGSQHSRRYSIGLIVLIVVRIAWALGVDKFVGSVVTRAAITGQRFPTSKRVFATQLHPIVTTAATLAAAVFLSGTRHTVAGIFVGLTTAALLAVHSRTPRLLCVGAPRLHRSWLPASLATVGLGLVGLGFAPPPPLTDDADSRGVWVRRSGVAALAVLALALTVSARLTAVPIVRACAQASSLITASALLPLAPLDGARLGVGRRRDLAITLALAATTVAFALGWV